MTSIKATRRCLEPSFAQRFLSPFARERFRSRQGLDHRSTIEDRIRDGILSTQLTLRVVPMNHHTAVTETTVAKTGKQHLTVRDIGPTDIAMDALVPLNTEVMIVKITPIGISRQHRDKHIRLVVPSLEPTFIDLCQVQL